jgi:hypothetical protein
MEGIENIVLAELSQKLNDKYHMFLTLYVEVKNGG